MFGTWRNFACNQAQPDCLFGSNKPITDLDLLVYAWHTEGSGFIEFEISNNTISTVFRQPLTIAVCAHPRARVESQGTHACMDAPMMYRRTLQTSVAMLADGWTQMATAFIHSTACLIEALVISNTTAHEIDARNKLTRTLTVLKVCVVASFPFCRNPVVTYPRSDAQLSTEVEFILHDGGRVNLKHTSGEKGVCVCVCVCVCAC